MTLLNLGYGAPWCNSENFSGQQADQEISSTPGVVEAIIIGVAGDASSTVELFDNGVSGTKKLKLSGAAAREIPLGSRGVKCATDIHVKTVDGGGTMDVTVIYRSVP